MRYKLVKRFINFLSCIIYNHQDFPTCQHHLCFFPSPSLVFDSLSSFPLPYLFFIFFLSPIQFYMNVSSFISLSFPFSHLFSSTPSSSFTYQLIHNLLTASSIPKNPRFVCCYPPASHPLLLICYRLIHPHIHQTSPTL